MPRLGGPLARQLVASALSLAGITRLMRAMMWRRGRLALMFHGVPSRWWPGVTQFAHGGIPRRELDRLMVWMAERWRFLSVEEFADPESHGLLLTFDDGLANNYTNALPLIRRHRAPAVFFVSTQHMNDPKDWLPHSRLRARDAARSTALLSEEMAGDLFDGMSREQVEACARDPLVTIGSHTVSHPFLTTCTDRELARELAVSRESLKEVTGKDVSLIAYPTGDYDCRVMAAIERCGYSLAFAVRRKFLGKLQHEIPRAGVYSASLVQLDAKLAGFPVRPLTATIPITGMFGEW